MMLTENDLLPTITHRIEHDEYPSSPREWDNLGVMLTWHTRYLLGDDQINPGQYDSLEDVLATIREDHEPTVILPLYLLDHSGLAIRSGEPVQAEPPRSKNGVFIGDPQGWDTSFVGFVFDSKDTRTVYDDPSAEDVRRILEAEVEIYDTYLQGMVYAFFVEVDGEIVDSCGGFYEEDDAESEAKHSAEHERTVARRKLAEEQARQIAASATYAFNPEVLA